MKQGLGSWFLGKLFKKFWLGWVPFGLFVFVLAPYGILNVYCGIFPCVHALSIHVVQCCMPSVCQNVQVTFLWCFWFNWVSMLGFTIDWTCLTCFDHWVCFLHTLPNLCLTMSCHASPRHTLGIHQALPHAQLLFSYFLLMFTCFSTLSMLF